MELIIRFGWTVKTLVRVSHSPRGTQFAYGFALTVVTLRSTE